MSWLTSSRRGARLVVPVTGLLLLAACTNGTPEAAESSTPAVVVTPSPTSTPRPTVSPSVDVTVKPARPAALDEPPSADGAAAIAAYFILLFPYVNATGDLSDWKALSHPDCVFCASVVSTVETKTAAGQHDQGGTNTITAASGTEVNPEAFYSAKIDLIQDASVTVDPSGTVIETFPGPTAYHIDLALVWDGAVWRIREATPVEVPAP